MTTLSACENHDQRENLALYKPVNVVEPVSTAGSSLVLRSSPLSVLANQSFDLDLPILGPSAGVHLLSYKDWHENTQQVEKLKEENARNKAALDLQYQVNVELKRLLVASVGDNLQKYIEKLVREKAEINEELLWYKERMMKDHETLDKLYIQADMWRSKFLGSKMMGDELARGKAFYAVRYQESQDALLSLLQERHELGANLLPTLRNLNDIKSAFDPLGSRTSISASTPPSADILRLSASIQQKSQTVKFRLLPPALTLSTGMKDISVVDRVELTPAETFAQHVLQCRIDANDSTTPLSPSIPRVQSLNRINRYHLSTRFDNLTYNCCSKCNGEIHLV